jgi:hypothetical protein
MEHVARRMGVEIELCQSFPERTRYRHRQAIFGVDLFSLPKVTVGKLALAWGWLRKPMIPLAFLFTFQSPFEGVKA